MLAPSIRRGCRPRRAAVTLAAAVVCGGALAQPAADAERLEAARNAYERGHYAQAFEGFAQLADAGHCEAARTARQMLRYGRVLYGSVFSVAAERRAHWDHPAGCPASATHVRPLHAGAPT